jgi:hypothetical protein
MPLRLKNCTHYPQTLDYRRSVSQFVLRSRPICRKRPGFCYCQTVAGLMTWGAFSDERTGLSFIHAAGSCQRSHSQVWVPSNSRPYFTVSFFRLPFSSPPTTRRVTVEVFDPASTRVMLNSIIKPRLLSKKFQILTVVSTYNPSNNSILYRPAFRQHCIFSKIEITLPALDRNLLQTAWLPTL